MQCFSCDSAAQTQYRARYSAAYARLRSQAGALRPCAEEEVANAPHQSTSRSMQYGSP